MKRFFFFVIIAFFSHCALGGGTKFSVSLPAESELTSELGYSSERNLFAKIKIEDTNYTGPDLELDLHGGSLVRIGDVYIEGNRAALVLHEAGFMMLYQEYSLMEGRWKKVREEAICGLNSFTSTSVVRVKIKDFVNVDIGFAKSASDIKTDEEYLRNKVKQWKTFWMRALVDKAIPIDEDKIEYKHYMRTGKGSQHPYDTQNPNWRLIEKPSK